MSDGGDSMGEKPDASATALTSLRRGVNDAFLVVVLGPEAGRRHAISRSSFVIGRNDGSDLVLKDDRVAGRHVEIVAGPAGHRLKDLGSPAGTLLNALPVQDAVLSEGDVVQVGGTALRYSRGDSLSLRGPTTGAQVMTDPGTGAGWSAEGGRRSGGARVERVVEPQIIGGGGFTDTGNFARPPRSRTDSHRAAGVATGSSADAEMNLEEMVGNARRFVRFFWPFHKIIGILAGVGLLAGLVSFVLRPPAATATFEINLVDDRKQGDPLNNRWQAAASNFRSVTVIERALAEIGIPNANSDLVSIVQRNLYFESLTPNFGMPMPTQTFAGAYSSADKDMALKYLETHIRAFLDVETEKTIKVIRSKVEYLKEQVSKADAELQKADDGLSEFKKSFLASLPENAAKSQEFLFDLEKRESDLVSGLEKVKFEIETARRGGGKSKRQSSIESLKLEMAEARSRGLADGHPDMVVLRERLERLQRSPDEGTSGTSGGRGVGTLLADEEAKKGELQRVRDQIAKLRSAIASMPDYQARYSDLTRGYESSKRAYDKLTDELKEAEYELGLEKQSAEARYNLTKRPVLEKQSTMKGLIKRVIVFGGGGFAFGMGFAVMVQVGRIWRRSKD